MQTEVYERAVVRIANLQAELQRLETFVSTYEALAHENEMSDRQLHFESLQSSSLRRGATRNAEVGAIVLEVIAECGAPVRRAELFKRVTARGASIGGRKPLVNFSSKLSRMATLINLPKFGYWPKDRPFEPAGYRPDLRGRTLAN